MIDKLLRHPPGESRRFIIRSTYHREDAACLDVNCDQATALIHEETFRKCLCSGVDREIKLIAASRGDVFLSTLKWRDLHPVRIHQHQRTSGTPTEDRLVRLLDTCLTYNI